MVDNEHNAPDTPRDIHDPEPNAPVDHDAQARDHELFAHDPADSSAYDANASVSEPEAVVAAPPRKRRGFFGKFIASLAVLALLLTAGGISAVVFKDKDERLRAVSEAIDSAVKDPGAIAAEAEAKLADWWKETIALVDGEGSGGAKPKTQEKTASNPKRAAAKPPAEPLPVIESQNSVPTPAPGWAAPQDAKPDQTVRSDRPPPLASAAPDSPARSEDRSEIQALSKRVEQLEATTREAMETARDAQRNAKSDEANEKPAAPTGEEGSYLNALEGRIDELADEIRKVRERLDEPKAETRVAPEASDTNAAAPAKGAASAEVLSLAQSLQHALERGRPFAAQLGALSERGVDSKLLTPLAPFAENGAPTLAHLLAEFKPIAKRLRALENQPSAGASLTDQLLHDAGKLVRVRPVGEATAVSINENVEKIETGLAHDDLDAASEAFEKLPEKARAEAQSFGETLNQRREADRAAASLITAALAGFGHNKN